MAKDLNEIHKRKAELDKKREDLKRQQDHLSVDYQHLQIDCPHTNKFNTNPMGRWPGEHCPDCGKDW